MVQQKNPGLLDGRRRDDDRLHYFIIIIYRIGFMKKYFCNNNFRLFLTKNEKDKNQDKLRPTTKSIQ
jgi:hypothetical protein